MATVEAVLVKKKLKDETYPLAIRVLKDRKPSFYYLNRHVSLNEWDAEKMRVRKSHSNSGRLNHLITTRRKEVADAVLDYERTNRNITAAEIVKAFRNTLAQPQQTGGQTDSTTAQPVQTDLFFTQANLHVENLKKNGKYGRHTTEKARVQIFKDYAGKNLTFSQVTVNLLNGFRAYLAETKKVGERTIMNYFLLVRTIYNQAVNNKFADKDERYPFGKNKIVIRFPKAVKIGLNKDEVREIENAHLTGYDHHARNVWLVSFYFAGMRLSDVIQLRWTDFHDGRLHYAMNKNDKADSLKVPDKVLAIIDQYKNDEPKHGFIFPELKVLDELDQYQVERKIAYAGNRIGKAMKEIVTSLGITKRVTMHKSRHSFAQIAGGKIDVEVLQVLYRHTDIATTIGYQGNFVHEIKDEALNAVLNF